MATLTRRTGIEPIYRRPNTSKHASGQKIRRYLLLGLKIDRPNQVCAKHITYIPVTRGLVYLNWFTRRMPSGRLSITIEVKFCLKAVKEALSDYGKPAIFNTKGQSVRHRRVHRATAQKPDRDQHG